MTPELRPMATGDLEAVLAVVQESPEAPRWSRSDYEAFLVPALGPLRRAALVAVFQGEVLGFAAVRLLLDGEENRCELESIAVRPAARKRGIGGALLGALLGWAAREGARQFVLEVRAGNAAAIRLYEQTGLHREGVRARYYADPEEDALLMGIRITSGTEGVRFSTGKQVEGEPPRC